MKLLSHTTLIILLISCHQTHIAETPSVTTEIADGSQNNTTADTPLNAATEMSLTDKLIKMLKSNGVNTRSATGATLLHYAAARDQIDTLNLLLSQQNIDLNPLTKLKKQSPLHAAASECANKAAVILLKQPKTNADLTNSDGQTAYQVATAKGCHNSESFKR